MLRFSMTLYEVTLNKDFFREKKINRKYLELSVTTLLFSENSKISRIF